MAGSALAGEPSPLMPAPPAVPPFKPNFPSPTTSSGVTPSARSGAHPRNKPSPSCGAVSVEVTASTVQAACVPFRNDRRTPAVTPARNNLPHRGSHDVMRALRAAFRGGPFLCFRSTGYLSEKSTPSVARNARYHLSFGCSLASNPLRLTRADANVSAAALWVFPIFRSPLERITEDQRR